MAQRSAASDAKEAEVHHLSIGDSDRENWRKGYAEQYKTRNYPECAEGWRSWCQRVLQVMTDSTASTAKKDARMCSLSWLVTRMFTLRKRQH